MIFPKRSVSCDCPSVRSGRNRGDRARSVPSARPFRAAMCFGAAHFLCVIVTLTAAIVFFTDHSRLASQLLLGGMAASAVTWLLAFIKRRGVYCPLCKGTPLVNSGARPHVKARRIPPFNHGTTAMFSLLACQRFRCMYCGENFDLMKPSNRILGGGESGQSSTAHSPAR